MKKITLLLSFFFMSLGATNAQTIETFDNLEISGNAYVDGSFIGVDGIEWTYVHVTGEQSFPIDGKGILLRRANEPSSLSATLPNGIADFSVDTRKAFGANAQRRLELVINGDVVQQFEPEFPAGESDLVVPFIVNGIDVEGPVVLELRLFGANGNQQMVLDNLTWTNFGEAGQTSLVVTSPSQDQQFNPTVTSLNVNFSVSGFDVSSSASANDGDGYVQYSLNQSPFEDVFTNSFLLEDLTPGAYSLIVKLVDNNGADLDPAVQVTRDFSVAAFTEVADISALRADVAANGPGGFYEITGASIFIHGDNFNNRKWFQDNNGGGIQLFDSQQIIDNGIYNVGDNVVGLKGVASVFNGVIQLAPLDNSATVNGNTEPNVSVISMQEYIENFQNYESTLIGIQNVTYAAGDGVAVFANAQNYTIEAGELSVIHRTDFFNVDYIGELIPQGMIQGVRGVANSFNGTAQILPRNAADINVTLNTIQFDRNEFSIYPNPANGVVNLVAPRGEKFSVEVYNVLGRRVLSTELEDSKQINVQNFQSGVYLVKFAQGRQSYTRKLIIK